MKYRLAANQTGRGRVGWRVTIVSFHDFAGEGAMNRDELLDLCERYVRRRMALRSPEGGDVGTAMPLVQIVDGYLHGEISESEKNALVAYVRRADPHDEDDAMVPDVAEATLVELDDLVG